MNWSGASGGTLAVSSERLAVELSASSTSIITSSVRDAHDEPCGAGRPRAREVRWLAGGQDECVARAPVKSPGSPSAPQVIVVVRVLMSEPVVFTVTLVLSAGAPSIGAYGGTARARG